VSTPSEAKPELPVGFRGYDRGATKAILARLQEQNSAMARERDDLRRQVDELAQELEHHRGRVKAVADALVSAQLVAVDLREAAEAKIEQQRRAATEEQQQLKDEGLAIRAKARQDATEIIREARIRADKLIEEVVGALEEYRNDTDQFLTGTRERLDSLVRDLLGRIPGSAARDFPPAQDEAEDGAPSAGAAAA
jgi:cell division septum initiation protein DivIVA